MKDIAADIDYVAVAFAGGLGRCDADDISRHLRRTPYNRGGYLYPVEAVQERELPFRIRLSRPGGGRSRCPFVLVSPLRSYQAHHGELV